MLVFLLQNLPVPINSVSIDDPAFFRLIQANIDKSVSYDIIKIRRFNQKVSEGDRIS